MDAASKGAGETGALRAEERTSRLQPRAIESWEDCVRLDLATIQVKYVGGEWKIVDGPSGSHWAFGFGAEKAEAEKALKIIKSYRLSHSCFVTRPGPKMAYQLIQTKSKRSGFQRLFKPGRSFKGICGCSTLVLTRQLYIRHCA
jgi:hypothetical protein